MVESARALATFHDDPVGLVTACRRVVSRQITSGGLWWVCSRLLTSPEPLSEVHAIVESVEDDTTPRSLTLALDPDATVAVLGWPSGVADALVRRGSGETLVIDAANEGSSLVRYLNGHGVDSVDVPFGGLGAAVAAADVLVLEACAASPTAAMSVAGSLAAAAVARHESVPVWLTVGVGRALPERLQCSGLGQGDVDAVEQLVHVVGGVHLGWEAGAVDVQSEAVGRAEEAGVAVVDGEAGAAGRALGLEQVDDGVRDGSAVTDDVGLDRARQRLAVAGHQRAATGDGAAGERALEQERERVLVAVATVHGLHPRIDAHLE